MDSDDALKLIEAYGVAFSTPGGIAVLRDLIEVSGFLSVFPTGAEPLALAHQNGTRAVFAHVYTILMLSKDGREALAVAMNPAATME